MKLVKTNLKFKKSGTNPFVIETEPHHIKLHTVCLMVGKRGSGKTFMTSHLLKWLEFDRIILVSPTFDSNQAQLKGLPITDVLDPDDPQVVQKIYDIVDAERDDLLRYREQLEMIKQLKDTYGNTRDLMDDYHLFYEYIDQRGNRIEPKHKWGGRKPRIVVFVDDSQSTKIFRNNQFLNLVINDIPLHRNFFDHGEAPLTVTQRTPTSATALNDPKAVLHLTREGTGTQAFGARATFKLSRYENVSTDSRSRLDLVLADGNYDDTTAMTVRSDGRVGIEGDLTVAGTYTGELNDRVVGLEGEGYIIAFHNGNYTNYYAGDTDVNQSTKEGRVWSNSPPGLYPWGRLVSVYGGTFVYDPIEDYLNTDVLLVAGGGGGSPGVNGAGGGGGAGGFMFVQNATLSSGSKTNCRWWWWSWWKQHLSNPRS